MTEICSEDDEPSVTLAYVCFNLVFELEKV